MRYPVSNLGRTKRHSVSVFQYAVLFIVQDRQDVVNYLSYYTPLTKARLWWVPSDSNREGRSNEFTVRPRYHYWTRHPKIWCSTLASIQVPFAYQANALPIELRKESTQIVKVHYNAYLLFMQQRCVLHKKTLGSFEPRVLCNLLLQSTRPSTRLVPMYCDRMSQSNTRVNSRLL